MKRINRHIFIAAFVLLPVTSATLAAPAPPDIFQAGQRVLFQGDSITDMNRGRTRDPNHLLGHSYAFLIGAQYGASYPERQLVFINRGNSGDTVEDLAKRWKSDAIELKPDVLSVLVGVNDIGSAMRENGAFSADAYEKGYDQLLADAVAANSRIRLVLCEPFILPGKNTSPKWDDWRRDVAAAQAVVQKLAQKYKAPVVPLQRAFDEAAKKRVPAGYWIWDGIHPTYSGQQILADEWVRTYATFYGTTPPTTHHCHESTSSNASLDVIVNADAEPMARGKFEPTWQSLEQYRVPDWFRDAKFGIWAHWGPQCEPEQGDWYARHMYMQGHPHNKFHVQRYGHPSQAGFKEVIREFKAENWNPRELVALYKRAGAQYFMAMANHHDNFDLWDSKHHAWNATKMGPQKNLIAGWAKAARQEGLRFGVSVHAAHAWMWYEPSQGADKTGPLAGVPYDARLTKADGKGTWWEGLDPQQLYAQNHPLSQTDDTGRNWNWGNGCSQPDQAYCQAFYNRTIDLINQSKPDLIYFDDTALPLWPVSDAGLKIAAHFYNSNTAQHGRNLEAVLFGKILDEQQRRCLVWDIERGQSDKIEPLPWQTDTCLGGWHYDRNVYNRNGCKSAATVIRTLCDVVSKNGNLLLSVPVRADGTIDEKERAIVQEIGAWLDVNGEAIFATRPWKVCGEGPQLAAAAAPLSGPGFNEGKGKRATPQDIRFTTKGDTLYVISLGVPKAALTIKSLGQSAGSVSEVAMLGSEEKLEWSRAAEALTITPPVKNDARNAVVFKVTLAGK